MFSHDNVESLWKNSALEYFSTLNTPKEGASSDGLVVAKHANKEWIQRKVQYLYAVQGARLQDDFKIRPKQHKLVEGVMDPVSFEDAERQKKKYNELVEKIRANRVKEKKKADLKSAEKLIKDEEEKRNKQEELRKSEEQKRQQKEKAAKEETTKKAAAKAQEEQDAANVYGLARDPLFMTQDMQEHLSIDKKFPKFQPQNNQSIFLVTITGQLKDAARDKAIINNRKQYCEKHGYKCLFPEYKQVPEKFRWWASVYTLREFFLVKSSKKSSSEIKEGDWVWLVSPDVLIMNMNASISDTLLQPDSLKARLSYGSRFQTGRGNYHPSIKFPAEVDSVSKLDLIVSRRYTGGFNAKSFLIRNTESTRFWLEVWDDHVVASEKKLSDENGEGNILQYLYLNHVLLRENVGVVTPRLLGSTADDSSPEYHRFKAGDLAALLPLEVQEEKDKWLKLVDQST